MSRSPDNPHSSHLPGRRSAAARPPRRRPVRRALCLVTAATLAAGPRPGVAQQVAPEAADELPLRRWLVSDVLSIPADGGGDPLTGPGATVVLPDRGVVRGGTAWRLLRLEPGAAVELDAPSPVDSADLADSADSADLADSAQALAFAHAYARSPEDRVVRLAWSGGGETRVRAWLNGRPLLAADGEPLVAEGGAETTARVVLGTGWNTLLLRAEAGPPGPFELAATLYPGSGGARAEEGGLPSRLDGIRVQASRPPGDVRTGPAEPRVLVAAAVRTLDSLAWREDRLVGYVGVDLTGWSRTPIDRVRLKAKVEGADAETVVPWLTPGRTVTAALPVPVDRIARAAAERRGVEAELRWNRRDEKRLLAAPATSPPGPTPGRALALLGWKVRAAAEGTDIEELQAPDRLPRAAGWVAEGEWRVPETLAGRRLTLDAAAAPGEYQLDGRPLPAGQGPPVLCDPCREGDKWKLAVRTTDRWEALPHVTVEPAGGAERNAP
ncbi:MAG: hypothetical protein RRA92_02495 [Gemmatimonadota bacterium]|nr:hypothetical protein [Gemmatimonadota bacterium]